MMALIVLSILGSFLLALLVTELLPDSPQNYYVYLEDGISTIDNIDKKHYIKFQNQYHCSTDGKIWFTNYRCNA